MWLRRRLELSTHVTGITLTTLGDPFLVLRLGSTSNSSGPSPSLANKNLKEVEEDTSHWVPDATVTTCPITQQPFGLLTRRHHCRFDGKIYSSEACHRRCVVPDRHVYTPARVATHHLGYISTEDATTDHLLSCERKSELLALILDAAPHLEW